MYNPARAVTNENGYALSGDVDFNNLKVDQTATSAMKHAELVIPEVMEKSTLGYLLENPHNIGTLDKFSLLARHIHKQEKLPLDTECGYVFETQRDRVCGIATEKSGYPSDSKQKISSRINNKYHNWTTTDKDVR